jgi:hypothetical protein
MLMRGAPDKVVAARLGVSPHTAREHAGRILRKFGVRTRGELQAALFGAHYDPWLAASRPGTGSAEAAGAPCPSA